MATAPFRIELVSARLLAVALLSFSSAAADAQGEGKTLVAQSSQANLWRALAAPGNTGLWLQNKTGQSLVCDIGYYVWDMNRARASIPITARIEVGPYQTQRHLANVVATTNENFSCRQDPAIARANDSAARRQREEDERNRLALLERERERERAQRAAELARGSSEISPAASAERQRQETIDYQTRLKREQEEQDRRSYEAARHQAIQLQAQQEQRRAATQAAREEQFNRGAAVLLEWARKKDARDAAEANSATTHAAAATSSGSSTTNTYSPTVPAMVEADDALRRLEARLATRGTRSPNNVWGLSK